MYDVVFKPKNMSPKELKNGVKKMYEKFYSFKHTANRITRSMKLGFYPFFLVLFRNIITTMGSKNIKN